MNNRQTPLEKEILSGKPVITLTSGDSMEPLLFHHSTRVVIVKAHFPLKKGDLPVYKRPSGQFVMHRIVDVKEPYYYTRGDNRYFKEEVPQEWILGIVKEIYRKDKHFMVSDWRYRIYVKVWNIIFPLRYLLYRVKQVKKLWLRKEH